MIPARDSVVMGMGLSALAYFLFAVHDASIKWLVADLPAWEVLCFRSSLIVIGCLAFGRAPLLDRALATKLKGALLGRAVITLIAWLCYYSAARYLPLAQMITLYFSSPIIVTALAVPLLGERITPARGVAVGIGFAGVMVASDPGGVSFGWPSALVLIAAALWGYGIILMRQIALRESTLLQMLYGNVVFVVATAFALPLGWHTPTWSQVGLLVVVGGFGGMGQLCLFEAARRAPAAVTATTEYTALIWAFVLGFAIWGDVPKPAIWIGAALIAVAGVVLVVGEKGRGAGPNPAKGKALGTRSLK